MGVLPAQIAAISLVAVLLSTARALTFNGSGASFVDSLFQEATFAYQFVDPDDLVQYKATGSTAGKCSIMGYASTESAACASHADADTRLPLNDFVGSDALLKEEDYAAFDDLQMFPSIAGAVVPIYNLPSESPSGVPLTGTLRLDREVLPKIFLGEIRFWNDSAIVAANPHIAAYLSDIHQEISVCTRLDGSGTTEIFTTALAQFPGDFQARVSSGEKPKWCDKFTSEMQRVDVNEGETFALRYGNASTACMSGALSNGDLVTELETILGANNVWIGNTEDEPSAAGVRSFMVGFTGDFLDLDVLMLDDASAMATCSGAANVSIFQEGALDASHFNTAPATTEVQQLCVPANELSIAEIDIEFATVATVASPITTATVEAALNAAGFPFSDQGVTQVEDDSHACFQYVSSTASTDVDQVQITSSSVPDAYIATLTQGGFNPVRYTYTGGSKSAKAGRYDCYKARLNFQKWSYTAGKSNPGVASAVAAIPFSMGYSVLQSALIDDIPMADMKNQAGNIVTASFDTISYAVMERGGEFDERFNAELADSASSDAWPMSGYSYFVIRMNHHIGSCERRKAILAYLEWYYNSPAVASSAARLGFAILPNFIAQQVVDTVLRQARCNDESTPALADFYPAPVPFQSTSAIKNIMDTYFSVYTEQSSATWNYTAGYSISVVDQFAAGQTFSAATLTVDARSKFEAMDHMFGGPFMYLGVGVFAHLEGSSGQIKVTLSPALIDKIYQGAILFWNDPAIQDINTAVLPATKIVPTFQQGDSEDNAIFTTFMAEHADETTSPWVSSSSFVGGCPHCASYLDSWVPLNSPKELDSYVSFQNGAVGYGAIQGSIPTTSAMLRINNTEFSFSTEALMACEPTDLSSTIVEKSQLTGSEDAITTARLFTQYFYLVDTLKSTHSSCWPVTASVHMFIRNQFSDAECDTFAEEQIRFIGFLFDGDEVTAPLSSTYSASPASSVLRSNLYAKLELITCHGLSVLQAAPECTIEDYVYKVTSCDASSVERVIKFSKFDGSNCQCGVEEPPDYELECDYLPVENGLARACIAMAALGMAFCTAVLIWATMHRRQRMIRKAQFYLLVVFMIGAIMMNATMILMVGPNSDTLCLLRPWFFNVSAVVMFAPLYRKMYKLYRIFNNPTLKRFKKVTKKQSLLTVAAVVAVDVLLMIIWTAVDTPRARHFEDDPTGYSSVTVDHKVCTTDGSPFVYVFVVEKALLVIAGMHLAMKCWQVDEELSESKPLALAFYNIAFVGAIAYAIVSTIDPDITTRIPLQTFAMWMIANVSVACVMVPKMFTTIKELRSSVVSKSNSQDGSDNRSSKRIRDTELARSFSARGRNLSNPILSSGANVSTSNVQDSPADQNGATTPQD